jgi:hypothetical protein
MNRDMLWRWDQVLKTHPNGMRFSCFGEEGELLATNEYFRYAHSTSYRSYQTLTVLLALGEDLLLTTRRKADIFTLVVADIH